MVWHSSAIGRESCGAQCLRIRAGRWSGPVAVSVSRLSKRVWVRLVEKRGWDCGVGKMSVKDVLLDGMAVGMAASGGLCLIANCFAKVLAFS